MKKKQKGEHLLPALENRSLEREPGGHYVTAKQVLVGAINPPPTGVLGKVLLRPRGKEKPYQMEGKSRLIRRKPIGKTYRVAAIFATPEKAVPVDKKKNHARGR